MKSDPLETGSFVANSHSCGAGPEGLWRFLSSFARSFMARAPSPANAQAVAPTVLRAPAPVRCVLIRLIPIVLWPNIEPNMKPVDTQAGGAQPERCGPKLPLHSVSRTAPEGESLSFWCRFEECRQVSVV